MSILSLRRAGLFQYMLFSATGASIPTKLVYFKTYSKGQNSRFKIKTSLSNLTSMNPLTMV